MTTALVLIEGFHFIFFLATEEHTFSKEASTMGGKKPWIPSIYLFILFQQASQVRRKKPILSCEWKLHCVSRALLVKVQPERSMHSAVT